MCGVAALQLRDPGLQSQLGRLLTTMMCQVAERGPDSAGVGIYGDHADSEMLGITLIPGASTVGPLEASAVGDALTPALDGARLAVTDLGQAVLVRTDADASTALAAIATAVPEAVVAGLGSELLVVKGVGRPADVAAAARLEDIAGWQGISHTRMATESAVSPAGAHPYAVAPELALVHNGSFANHVTIRRDLERVGVVFDSDNDSEVAARYIAYRMSEGESLVVALRKLCDSFDGFFTLVVTTASELAVVRDPIACKPALVAETESWVAIASEYRALAQLPGVEGARIFEPEPGRVYSWAR